MERAPLALCSHCGRKSRRCVCPFLRKTPLSLSTQLTLLQTDEEWNHPKNTGAILIGSLTTAQRLPIRLKGGEVGDACGELARSMDTRSVFLLYPTHEETEDTELWARCAEEPSPHLLLIDTTWRQSLRLYRQSALIRALPHLSLPIEAFTQLERCGGARYHTLRTGPKKSQNKLSTFEAGLLALAWLEKEKCGSFSKAWELLEPLWEQYDHWVKALSQQFKRARAER